MTPEELRIETSYVVADGSRQVSHHAPFVLLFMLSVIVRLMAEATYWRLGGW